jgi:hypothetical protein
MDTAINLLHHLATAAAYDGEPCAQVLFQAADFLQDVLDCHAEVSEQETTEATRWDLETLLTGLSEVSPEKV